MRFLSLNTNLGIDLGTSNVLVYQHGKGIVLREPAMVAVTRNEGKLVAIGEEAREMLGRTPGNIQAVSPLKEGVIANYSVAAAMLRHIIDRLCGRGRMVHPEIAISVPSGSTSVERRAVLDIAHDAGARLVYPLLTPVAAAIGAGLPVTEPYGSLVVDIGGGVTDIAVISLGGMVSGGAVRVGGRHLDETIVRYIRREYNMVIGERMAEDVKTQIGSAAPLREELTMDVRGRDVMDGLPKTVQVGSKEIREALQEPLTAIAERVCQVLAQTPPELAADIMERGMVLTGGGALLRNMATFISSHANAPARVAPDPLSCVVLGTGQYMASLRRQQGGWQPQAPTVTGGPYDRTI
ncbi:MAG TPA: rod shape-determining protein [Armatimonadota bacterium]|nr:rod shape-determining protein [Armatimonadota bacterium]